MYLSDKQLGERFSVARGTIWRWHRTDPQFPRAVTLSSGCTRWRLEDIEAWEAQVVAERGAA